MRASALIVLTDGRVQYLERTLSSTRIALSLGRKEWIERHIINDCPEPEYQDWLEQKYGAFYTIHPPEDVRRGFGGAIQKAWSVVGTEPDFVFHLEDDFIFQRKAPVDDMQVVLDAHPYLAQMALRRQPWNDVEMESGGVVEVQPDSYVDRDWDGKQWLEHRLFFTTNPSFYRRELLAVGWPDGEQSEGVFTHQLVKDRKVQFGYWGARDTPPWVLHIGLERAGMRY